jgi:hypothetical protein
MGNNLAIIANGMVPQRDEGIRRIWMVGLEPTTKVVVKESKFADPITSLATLVTFFVTFFVTLLVNAVTLIRHFMIQLKIFY